MINNFQNTYYYHLIFFITFLYVTSFNDEETILTILLPQRTADISSSVDPRTYVVIAADFDSSASKSNYGIITPLTCFIWSRVFNVTPVVILGTREIGRLTSVIEYSFATLIRQLGGRLHCITRSVSSVSGDGVALDPNLVGNRLITALQVSRVASLALSYMNEKDVLFTSDADIWPMSNLFWSHLISITLSPDNDNFLVYNGEFFSSQRKKKDCNFLALTSVAAKISIWRDIIFRWLDSLQYAPSPRHEFCVYSNNSDNNPILPWYTDKEYRKHNNNESSQQPSNSSDVSFPALLKIFLDQGKKVYGSTWAVEAWQNYTGDSYKRNLIWNYDQVLAAEMILASQRSVYVNEDFRRLDKFGPVGTDFQFTAAIRGKSVEDFTDAHLDGVEDSNWWRIEELWQLVFREKPFQLQSEAVDFLRDVREFSDMIKVNVYNPSLFEENNVQDSVGFCDKV
jgi:hypothetical protein